MKRRILMLLLVVVVVCSLLGCRKATTCEMETRGSTRIEKYYNEQEDLFCIVERDTVTNITRTTYFYWKYDSHGRSILDRTEYIVTDADGDVLSHTWTIGHS